jgi:hypothetical protein
MQRINIINCHKSMKGVIFSLFIILLFSECKKTEKNCTNAVVTLSAPSCKRIGVILDGIKYPADDLPAEYAEEGKTICIEYSFWDDPAMCACCGGRKVHIISIH